MTCPQAARLRIFAAGLGTETNSFSPLPTGLRGFDEYLRLPAGTSLSEPQEATGAPWAAQQYAALNGAMAVLGPVSFAMPAGPTVRHVYEALRDELLAALKDALPVDVVAYSLHGAMIAEGYDDCEGDLLARTRAHPIGAGLQPRFGQFAPRDGVVELFLGAGAVAEQLLESGLVGARRGKLRIRSLPVGHRGR